MLFRILVGNVVKSEIFSFFSLGSGFRILSRSPASTHQCMATERISISLAILSARSSFVSSKPNPLVLKSLNMASHPQRMP
ncbi:hypothetical protein GCAAIG_00235 [Candidatus Electronema halotolerans]